MNHISKYLTVCVCLAVGCGDASDDWPTFNAPGGGKAEGIGTGNPPADQEIKLRPVGDLPFTDSGTASVSVTYEGNTVETGYLFTHGSYERILIEVEGGRVSLIVDYRVQGGEWERLSAGPQSRRNLVEFMPGKLPTANTELFRKLLLVPATRELWCEAVLPGFWDKKFTFGLDGMVTDDVMEYRIFITPDWKVGAWDLGDSAEQDYTISFSTTNILQRLR